MGGRHERRPTSIYTVRTALDGVRTAPDGTGRLRTVISRTPFPGADRVRFALLTIYGCVLRMNYFVYFQLPSNQKDGLEIPCEYCLWVECTTRFEKSV